MNKYLTKAFRPLSDLAFLAVVWAVFFFKGRFLLYVQEQMQLFQNDWDYVAGNVTAPGGAATMLTEAIVQFYHIPWIGVTLISLVALAGYVLMRCCLDRISGDWRLSSTFALASVLPLIYCVIVCEDSLPLVSFALVAAASAGVMRIRSRNVWIVVSVLTPLLFFICGAAAIMMPLIFAAASLNERRDRIGIATALVPSAVYAVFGFAAVRAGLVGAASDLCAYTYPLYDDPEHDFNVFAMLPWYISVTAAAVLSVSASFRDGKLGRLILPVGVVFMLGSGMFLWLSPSKQYAQNVGFEVYSSWAKLHYLYSNGRYDDLLDIYGKDVPANSVESNYINLALYRTGRLASDFFKYKPSWLHNSLRTPWLDMPFPFPFIWIETCDQMGALSKAQQAAFEGNVLAGPRGSAPMVKYLAESEIIRGNYTAADKFLSILDNTVFYREWAEQQRRFLDDKAVAEDAHYSIKRACYYTESRTLYDMNDLWLMTEVAKNSRKHYSTFEYCCLMVLSAGEVQTFLNFILQLSEAGAIRLPFAPIIQDALVMAVPNHTEIHKLYRIDPQRVADYKEYVAAVNGKSKNTLNTNAVISKNSTRVWHYINLLSKSNQKSVKPSK